MFKKIRKRDGRVVRFDSKKIADAIAKAGVATGEFDHKIARALTLKVLNLAQQAIPHRIPTVEGIQDVVEEVLLSSPYRKTARAYIIYREQHAGIREITAKADVNMVDQYLEKLDWQVNENSNMTFSLQGLNNYISSEISKTYWLIKIYPSEVRQAHLNGDFHIHDLNILSVYCVGWDLFDLLVDGFRGAPGKVESESAKHFRSALGQVVNFFYSLQGEAAGAQAFSNFDTLLAPFIRYDGLGYEEVKQALQEFVFNVNVPTRVGFQAPFTNITLDLVVPEYYANQSVVIGGVPQKETYNDFKDEIELFNRALLEVMAEGDAKGRVFTFPIPTYNITKDFDWANPNLDVLWQVTAKYGVPYFSNFINSDMNPEDARSMCPIGGNEKVLIKSNRGRGLEYSTIKYIYEGNAKGDVYEIYSDGKFVKGRFNKFSAQKMIKVTLENRHELKMTEEHLNFVMLSSQSEIEELKGMELREGMYLPYSLKAYEGSGGNRDMGYFVGAYAGDGSLDGETSVVFSLSSENEKKRELVRELIRIGEEYFGVSYATKSYEDSKLYTLKVHSRAAVGLCKDFVSGKERDKCYRARLFNTGKEFRKAVIEGHYATDGGNRNRIYTSSPKMVETLNMLAATLGTTTSVYMDNREGRLGTQPNYAVLIYQLNREKYGNIWFKHDNKLWVEIKSIESITDNTAYCFEVENGEPIFTVGTTGILTHNCRLRIDNRELERRGGGLFGSSPLTGSIGVVTINMPRLGYSSARDEEEFIMALERLMVLAKESLEIKRKVLENFMEKNLYPYTKYYLRGVKERFDEYWKNHFSTIGLVGMNEACLNMFGENIASEKSRVFTLRVLDFMRDKLLEFQEETGNNYNLEATPAEGTSYRLAKKDKESNPKIICANEDDWKKGAEPFYTNSTQLPVNYTDDVFEALDLQDEIQTKYTGGTVIHIFAGERVSDSNTLKALIRKICELYHLPYFTFTPTFSVCPTHGYITGEHYACPTCGAETEVYSRVVGYLRPVNQWNRGKQEEFKNRKMFDINKVT